ncbi:DUF427 domain-containing protein [Streptomyces radicis]|uniref:DUF427 domain-containing protein n=1 Tax=Streptomyces radicis TaxID=1750517 RepID=A0A3A9WJY5_9ACTN|nr:DUF427 domain-containing protein [Streptomyces radicis]RKN06427.1 DUF427 domain-containing protein [Streptomyces radicis]RKN20314.1 DUF427 domain-containing protein [Streptomyces radicis]
MTLTHAHGPLSPTPPETVNYTIEGPEHRLLLTPFPRRVRAEFGGAVVLDTREGKLLYETGLLPQLYVPTADVDHELLTRTEHSTYCPFKGDASYWTIAVGDRRAENAVWAYERPRAESAWLAGHLAPYWEAADAWYDEEERVEGHLRDLYHRVDVRRSGRHVRVLLDDRVLAETDRPGLLSETGLPNRYYIPVEDVRLDLLTESTTRAVCPYKGTAHYWSYTGEGPRVDDVAWSYPHPLEAASKVKGELCFAHQRVTTEVDGETVV